MSAFTQADEGKRKIFDFQANLMVLGDYICDVDNTDSKAANLPSDASDQATYTISIAYPPKVSVSPKEVVVTAGEGQNTLTCNSDAKPVGDYQWTKDGVDIDGATNATFLVDKVRLSSHFDKLIHKIRLTTPTGARSRTPVNQPTNTVPQQMMFQSE